MRFWSFSYRVVSAEQLLYILPELFPMYHCVVNKIHFNTNKIHFDINKIHFNINIGPLNIGALSLLVFFDIQHFHSMTITSKR